MGAVGHFVFSLDVELAWGIFDHAGVSRYETDLRQEGEIVTWLLSQLDAHQIPATWAIVGRLLLSQSDPELPLGYHDWRFPDAAAIPAREDPLWYAPELLEKILRSRVNHEIGTHTFSHVDAHDPHCTAEVLEKDLLRAKEVHVRHGLSLRSIVFPRNRVAHLDVLRRVGIIAYRGRQVAWHDRLPSRAHRAISFIERVAAVTPPTYDRPRSSAGHPTNVPASMFLYAREGSRRHIPAAARTRQAVATIRRAAERGETAHLWLHPYNLATDPTLRDTCAAAFAEVALWAGRGRIIPITMGDLAANRV